MPLYKRLTLPLLLLLACCSFQVLEIHAQQSPSGSSSMPSKTAVHSWNIHQLDSIRLHNEVGSFNTRMQISGKQLVTETGEGVRSAYPVKRPVKLIPRSSIKSKNYVMNRLAEICYTVSERNFLYQDSIFLWSGDPTLTGDGNVIVSGQTTDYSVSPTRSGGFCMKTDLEGNVIWAKIYDSAIHADWDYMNYFQSIELKNGSILLAGRTTNKISKNDDFVLAKLDNNGNLIWQKTYESRYWQGFNGSGDLFGLQDLEEDPVTGEIYFVGYHWGGLSTITKVHPSDGSIIWSNAYATWDTDQAFGIVINTGNLLLFQLENGSYNDSYVHATAINKTNGDTLFSKHFVQTGDDRYSARLFGTYEVVKQNNGHFLMSGPTTRYFEFPKHTGTIDLFHAGIIELDENLNFVRAYGVKNRIESNSYNTRMSLFPDGTGVFTMLHVYSGYTADEHISVFKNDQIYHQRKRVHVNEGLPREPQTRQLPDGGFLNIKLMGDSTRNGIPGSRLDYYRMHTSDTPSTCLGVKDTATSIWYFNFAPTSRRMDSIHRNVFRISRPKTFQSWDFTALPGPACQVISHCDTVSIKSAAPRVCAGGSVNLTVHKNIACGSLVPLSYDTNWVNRVTRLNDSTYSVQFNQPGKGFIRASVMGCSVHEDSVAIEVIATKYGVNLGRDTVICPGNRIVINAGKGFDSYTWQDGSNDSIYTVTAPGSYYVTAVNSCGNIYRDTVIVRDHPPVPISIGPDRFKCNNDQLQLTAPAGFLNYVWSADKDTSKLKGQQILVNPQVPTRYMIAAEKTPGCFAYDTLDVTVTISPKIYLGADTSICRNDSLTLTAATGFQVYQWNTGDQQQQLTVKKPGTYTVKAMTADGCFSYDTLKLLNLHNLPQPDLGPDSVICSGHPRILRSSGNYVVYSWNTGATTPSITANAPGSYWLSVTDINGCRGSDSTFIPSIEAPPAAAFLPVDTVICPYSSVILQPNTSFSRQLWNTGYTGPSITVSKAGVYWLEATNQHNCQARDSVVVTFKDCLEGLYVPSGFTPNKDGVNDVFTPLIFGDVKSFNFQVYNRWGQLVFQTTIPGKGWDGSYHGKPQDSNLFIWTCTYQLNGKNPEQKKGSVVVLK